MALVKTCAAPLLAISSEKATNFQILTMLIEHLGQTWLKVKTSHLTRLSICFVLLVSMRDCPSFETARSLYLRCGAFIPPTGGYMGLGCFRCHIKGEGQR